MGWSGQPGNRQLRPQELVSELVALIQQQFLIPPVKTGHILVPDSYAKCSILIVRLCQSSSEAYKID